MLTTVRPTTKTTTKEEFISVLRSGQYKQHFGTMTDGQGAYCAMGVLHAMNGDEGAEDISLSLLISSVLFSKIAEMNDSGVSFAGIADFLETVHDSDFYRP